MLMMDGGGGGYGAYPQKQIIDEIDKLADHAPQLIEVASATAQGAQHFSTTATTVTAQLSKLVAAWNGAGAVAAAGKFKAIGDWAQQSAEAAQSNATASENMYTAILQAKATVPRTIVDTSWNASLKAAAPAGAAGSLLSPVLGVATYAAAATADHNSRVTDADAYHSQAVQVMERLADRSSQVDGQTQPYPAVPFQVSRYEDQEMPGGTVGSFAGEVRDPDFAPARGASATGTRGSTGFGVSRGTIAPPIVVGSPAAIGSGSIGPAGPGQSGTTPFGHNPGGAPIGALPGGKGKNPGDPKSGGIPGETDPSGPGTGPAGAGSTATESTRPGRASGWTVPSGLDPVGSGPAGGVGGSSAAGFADVAAGSGTSGAGGAADILAVGGFATSGLAAQEELAAGGVGRGSAAALGVEEELAGGAGGRRPGSGSSGVSGRGSSGGLGAEEEYRTRSGIRGANGGFEEGIGSGGRGFAGGGEPEGTGYRGASGAGGFRGTGLPPEEEHGPSPYGQAGSAVGSQQESSSRYGSSGRAGTSESGLGAGGHGAAGWEEEYAAERYGTNPGMMPGGGGRRQDEEEYSSAAYLEESDDVWGEGRHVAPPVLG